MGLARAFLTQTFSERHELAVRGAPLQTFRSCRGQFEPGGRFAFSHGTAFLPLTRRPRRGSLGPTLQFVLLICRLRDEFNHKTNSMAGRLVPPVANGTTA